MRVDVAFILMSMGFVVDKDFVAVQTTPTNVDVVWKSQTVMPTVAAIDTAALTAVANIATKAAQAQKAAATASIDNGQLITGAQYERLVRALALMSLDEFNLHTTFEAALLAAIAAAATLAALKTSVAAITPIAQRTPAQLVTAIKAKIALTAE